MSRKARNMLTLQFIPYTDIDRLSSKERVEKLLKIVKNEKIILLQGRLTPEEEADLIKRTMEEITDTFTGVEISPITVRQKEDEAFFQKIKSLFFNFILRNRQGLTIIGPASIVKEIKQDPEKIQLFTEDTHHKRKRR